MGVVATKFEICTQAMLAIGAPKITNFDGSTPESAICGAIYPSILEAALQRHPWAFCTIFARQLARLDETPTNVEYSYVYQLPADLLSLMRVHDTNTYRIEQRKLLSNLTSVKVDYIFRVAESDFPAYFVLALAAEIAAGAAVPLTEDMQKFSAMKELAAYQWQRAQFDDAKQKSTLAYIDDGGLITARMGGTTLGYWYGTGPGPGF